MRRWSKKEYERRFLIRFWKAVNRFGDEDCWIWIGERMKSGYGRIWKNERSVSAHRIALEIKIGRRLKAAECSLHHCDNPSCVNPNHLWIGTKSENNSDRAKKGRNGKKWKTTATAARGSRHGSAKLNEFDIREIREMHRTGNYSQEQIARMFRVSQPLIGLIAHRRIWKHVA